MIYINIIAIKDEKRPEKSLSAAGLELVTSRSTVASDSSVLRSLPAYQRPGIVAEW